MDRSGFKVHQGRAAILLGVAAAFGISACGGSSNGNGEETTLSSEQVAALSAAIGPNVIGMTEDMAEDSLDQTGETAGDGGTEGLQIATTGAPEVFACEQGAIRSAEGNDTGLDINAETFPNPPFSGTIPVAGTSEYLQFRANCQDPTFGTIDGSLDVLIRENIAPGGASAIVYRAGGYQGADEPPDLDASYVSENEFGDMAFRTALRGEFFNCQGCVLGDLGNFSGDPERDFAVAAFLETEFDFGGEGFSSTMGQSFDDRLTFVGEASGAGTLLDLNGRLAFSSEVEACSFDVTYETVERPTLVGADDQATNGTFNVTDNTTGNTHVVAFDANGNVTVDGQPPADLDDLAEKCALNGNGGMDNGTGDLSGPEGFAEGLPWRSECQVLDGDTTGPTLWGDIEIKGLTGDATSGTGIEIARTFSNETCSGQPDDSRSGGFDYVIGDAVAGVSGAYEIDFLNRGGDGSDNIYEIFRIEDGVLIFGEYPEAGPDQPQFRPDRFRVNPVEFTSVVP